MEECEEEKSSNDRRHVKGLLRDILEGELEMKRSRVRPSLENFSKIIRYGTFREMKELVWDIVELRLVALNQS